MKKVVSRCLLILAFILLVPTVAGSSTGADQTLVILHTNDFHGHPMKFTHNGIPDVGGLPAIATLVEQVRAENDHVLVLDAGDLNTGTPESNLFKAVPDILGYNYIGYDAMALGNHEFDNPLSVLKKQERIARFPFLSANVKTRDGNHLVQPYLIKKFPGFSVGIVGLTLKETETIGNPEHVRDVVFEDEVETAREVVKLIRSKVDVLIALVHMGIWEDNARGSRWLAEKVKGIDLIVDGHTHTDLEEPIYVGGTPIVQASKWGLKVGKAVLRIDLGKVVGFEWSAVPVNLKERLPDRGAELRYLGERVEEDPFLLRILTPYAEKAAATLSEVVGVAGESLSFENVRKEPTELGTLVAEAMLWSTRNLKPDFALQNGGGIRTGLPAGTITKRIIYEMLPFENTVVVLKMNGHQVLRLFDFMATIPAGKGAFPQFSEGVSWDPGRSETVTINGRPIDAERTYSIATNAYLAAGGDGYKVFLEAGDKYDTSVFQRDAMIEYLMQARNKINPRPIQTFSPHWWGAQAGFTTESLYMVSAD